MNSSNILHCLSASYNFKDSFNPFISSRLNSETSVFFTFPDKEQNSSSSEMGGTNLASKFPPYSGFSSPHKLLSIAKALSGYDLIVTHGSDALNVAMAHRVFGEHLGLGPLVHEEVASSTFVSKEKGLKRKFFRRMALSSAKKLIVQTNAAFDFALRHWEFSGKDIEVILPGIDLKLFKGNFSASSLSGLIKRNSEFWIGAYWRPEYRSEAEQIIKALRELPDCSHVVFMCDEKVDQAVRNLVDKQGLSHRVHFLTEDANEAAVLGLCDTYVEVADPFSCLGVLKAKASSNPVLFVREPKLSSSLRNIMLDKVTRERIGTANRKEALSYFDNSRSIQARRNVYVSVLTSQ